MSKKSLVLASFVLYFVNSGCSIQRIAIGQLAPALSSSSPVIQEEKNWQLFRDGTPGSLQLSEILLRSDPGNEDLLALLTKGYAAYGYIVNDTLHLAERLADVDRPTQKQQAIENLSKSLRYGLQYLKAKGVEYDGLVKASKSELAFNYLEDRLDSSDTGDLETAFFSGTAWLLLANHRKDNMLLVSQVPNAFELINWVCKHRPDFQEGLCSSMISVYHLARPKSLGGKPQLAIKLLKEAMKNNPKNLLVPVVYMEWYLLPYEKEGEYKALKNKLVKQFREFRKNHYIPGEKNSKPSLLNLFNAMAERRLEAIVSNEAELF